ncbi:MAG: hypothetical protein ACRDE2_06855, partial [Chitinophagaceae bacterium]
MKTFIKFKSLCILFVISIFLFACNTTDQLVSRKILENKVLSEISKNGVSPDKLQGWCPYNCHDIRCRAYQYGYCGPDTLPPPPPDTIAVITNPNNPYDYTGADHNEAVKTIFPNINPSDPSVDSVIEAQIKSYAITNFGMNADTIQMVFEAMQQEWNVPPSQFPRMDSLGNDLYGEGQISSEANGYIQQIYSTASEWLNVDSLTQDEYTNFAFSLISIEDNISDDNNLSSNEKNVLLSVGSIARYSAEYWGNYINEQSSSQPSYIKGGSQ